MNKKVLYQLILLVFIVLLYLTPTYYRHLDNDSIPNGLISTNDPALAKTNYIAIIEIPKISLRKEIYDINSIQNDVNKNIELLKESDMPDVKKGNFILASHSGTSKISYFKKLINLKLRDKVYIYYNNEKYTYHITNIYYVPKTGMVEIIKNNDKTTLTMITCDQKDKTKQIVFIADLYNVEQL